MTFAIMIFRTLIKPFVPNGLIPSIHDNSPDLAGSLPVLKSLSLFLPISLFPPFFQLHVLRNFFQPFLLLLSPRCIIFLPPQTK